MYTADIPQQLRNIMPALGAGFLLGLVYEAVRIFRLYLSAGKVFVFITDMLFTVFTSVSVFMLFIAVDNGHIRFYMILACILGYTVCLFTAGELIYSFFLKIHGFVSGIIRFVMKPFVLILVKLSPLTEKISEKMKKIKNKLKNLLKRGDKVLYNNED